MPPTKGVWGIDIGQCGLKALRLEMVEGKPVATAFDYVEHPKILSQPDADPDMLIREALEKFLSRNPIKYDEVAIGIAGQSGLARFVKLPPVEEKKIGDIVKFEAKQQIPFPLEEVIWDYQKIAGGEVMDGFAMETEIGLFAMKKDVIGRYLGYFSGTKIEVHCVQMSPLALVNYVTYDVLKKGGTTPVPEDTPDPDADADDIPRGKKRAVVVLDIGTDASNLIITDGAKIIWQRPLPLGGNNFTRALTKELKLTFAKAEHLKRNAAKSPELPQILKALKPVLQDFVGEVQRSLGYFSNTHRDAHVSYMMGLGGAFRLPGFQKYLSEKLQLDVRKAAGFSRLTGDTVLKDPLFVENLLTFPVAYGLALQGLGEARLTTNLLPAEIRTDRLIRAKKPYAVAAASLLLLGTAGLAWGYGSNYKAISDSGIDKAISGTKGALSAFDAQESKYKGGLQQVEEYQGRVKAVIAGQDERLNWPRFNEVLSAAVPKPGLEPQTGERYDPKRHGNLPEELWRKDNGYAAVQWFMNRMRMGVPIELATEDERSAMPLDLAMVNVEAVYPRWADNLKSFFENVDSEVYGDPNQVAPTGSGGPGMPGGPGGASTGAAAKRGFGENIARFMKPDEKEPDTGRDRDKPKAPEGGGWIVEVRGYTDHRGGEQFIRRALLANLQRFDAFADLTDPKGTNGIDKVQKYLPGVSDPVRGRVSHAFIYHVWDPPANAQPNTLYHVNQSVLDPLIGGLAGGTGGGPGGGRMGMPGSVPSPAMPGPGGMPGGPGGPGGDSMGGAPAGPPAGQPWSPLTGAVNTMSGAGGPGMPGGPGSPFTPPPLSPMTTPGSGPGGIAPPPPPTTDGPPRRRYEFVVMFVWREPVPVVTPPEVLAGTPPGGSGMPGGPGMPGPGGPGMPGPR